jgi:hypothetical protein
MAGLTERQVVEKIQEKYSDHDPRPTPKKRQAKPGTRRVTVALPEAVYKRLEEVAEAEMREPNNMLAFLLKDRLEGLINDHVG